LIVRKINYNTLEIYETIVKSTENN
jgi:hypothetical protein